MEINNLKQKNKDVYPARFGPWLTNIYQKGYVPVL